ncbi:MAG: hypothetical protein EBR20_08230, partial [Bacteroidetes bacterium]|nr:hypothetical protein [Bacteroidota bacterium]
MAEVRASGADAVAEITVETIKAAEQLAGLSFTNEERELMLDGLQRSVADYEAIRAHALPNHVPPSLVFDPQLSGQSAPVLAAKIPAE